MTVTFEQRQKALLNFIENWPISRIESLTLEQYTKVDDKNTFTYWLEFGEGLFLGSIKGGDASKFGIYERKAEPKGNRAFIGLDERYSWKTKYGNSAESAFKKIKELILKVIKNTQNGDLESIENLDFESALKWKLAFLYQNHQKPCVLPIYQLKMLKALMNGETNITHSSAYRHLMSLRGQEPTLQYGARLWSSIPETEDGNTHDDESEETSENDDELLSGLTLPPLNQILFGPPGTGKTYETIYAALQILDPTAAATYTQVDDDQTASPAQRLAARKKLKARFDVLSGEQRVRFVTFHQSFSYEDFVEGLRAETDETTGQIRYEVVDGVFKSLCESASVKVTQQAPAPVDLAGRRIWKMSLGNTQGSDAGIFDECLQGGYVLLGYGEAIDFSGCKSRDDVLQRYTSAGQTIAGNTDYNLTSVTTFITRMQVGDLVVVSDGNFKFRAIGEITGDYTYKPHPDYDDSYAQMRPVKWLRQYNPSLPRTELLNGQFSQMTLYELRSPTLDQKKLQSLLADLSVTDMAPVTNARVLIIDEINRGNISRIFGELITLIEPSKRAGADEALSVTLPYSKEHFSVPDNVYIIGTMNTADRSLAGLDLALRRRFSFTEMPPRPELLDAVVVEGVNIGQMLRVMNQRITVLLDRDHTLGHTYFMPLQTEPTLPRLAAIFRQAILPLLQEYFFEDWERIRWVLNDQSKPQDVAFIIEDKTLNLAALFASVQDRLRQTPQWKLNDNAFQLIAAYHGIAANLNKAASTGADT